MLKKKSSFAQFLNVMLQIPNLLPIYWLNLWRLVVLQWFLYQQNKVYTWIILLVFMTIKDVIFRTRFRKKHSRVFQWAYDIVGIKGSRDFPLNNSYQPVFQNPKWLWLEFTYEWVPTIFQSEKCGYIYAAVDSEIDDLFSSSGER